MRIHVVSDVHGNVDALARAGEGADALVCLGDLILFIDYEDHGQGICGELCGQENADRFIALRTQKRFDEARDFSRRMWGSLEGDAWQHIERAVRGQYRALFDAMPVPAYLTYGNVDIPHMWADYVRDGHRVLDGEVVEIGGRTVAWVGGGVRAQYRPPRQAEDRAYAEQGAPVGAAVAVAVHT